MTENIQLNSTRERSFQFGIKHVLLLMIPLSILSIYVADRIRNRTLDWVPYSETELEHYLANKDDVILIYGQDWNAGSATMEQFTINDLELKIWIRQHGIVTIKADCTDGPITFRGSVHKLRSAYASCLFIPNGDFDRAEYQSAMFDADGILESAKEFFVQQ